MMNKNIVVPVEICVQRYYHTYVHIHEGATETEIMDAAQEQVIEKQDITLTLVPDLEIEEQDIMSIMPDYDGIMEESNIEELSEILKKIEAICGGM